MKRRERVIHIPAPEGGGPSGLAGPSAVCRIVDQPEEKEKPGSECLAAFSRLCLWFHQHRGAMQWMIHV